MDHKKEKKEKKEKYEKKEAAPELSVVLPASDEKLPEVRINGLQCKLQFVTVYNDQAELTYAPDFGQDVRVDRLPIRCCLDSLITGDAVCHLSVSYQSPRPGDGEARRTGHRRVWPVQGYGSQLGPRRRRPR